MLGTLGTIIGEEVGIVFVIHGVYLGTGLFKRGCPSGRVFLVSLWYIGLVGLVGIGY